MSENAVFDLLWAVQGRRSVLIVLQERFGSIPREIAERLEIIEDVAELEEFLRTAVTSPTLDAFLLRLEGATGEGAGHWLGILIVLDERFGGAPADIRGRLDAIKDTRKLEALVRSAAVAPTLEAFRDKLEDAGPGPGAS